MSEPIDCRHADVCHEVVHRLSKTVYGNGEPQKSMIVQVADMRRELNVIKKLSWVTAAGVVGMIGKLLVTWIESQIFS